MRDEPRGRRAAYAPRFLGRHHLQRIAEPGARFSLYLAEDERSPTADHQVELVAADPDVLAEDAVAAPAVVPTRSLLGVGARTPRVPRGPLTVRGRRG